MLNSNLSNAKKAKNDEFYTQLTDIEKELRHYSEHFKDKIVFCNCNDHTYSNFWKYFHLNFEFLGMKKLIATCYSKDSPSYKIEYSGGDDRNYESGIKIPLNGNGDFRSQECIDILNQSDVVVTNPPFSLFREYVAQLMEYDKKFVIIGNMNAITYKEIFPLIKNNKIWSGYSFNKTFEFSVPDYYETSKSKRIDENGRKVIKVPAICWFTNQKIPKLTEQLFLTERYDPERYPKYDNYDAINVDKVSEIPKDYDGVMGVPISFLDKYCPEQFEIIGELQSSNDEQAGIPNLKYYDHFKELRPDMTYTGSSGKKANGNPILRGKPLKGNFLYNENTGEFVHSLYARIIIKKVA